MPSSHEVELQEIVSDAMCRVSIKGETFDAAQTTRVAGSELLRVSIRIETKPGSALLRYRRLQP